MRLLGRVIGILLGIGVVLAAVAFLLPREVVVTRFAVINAPPSAVFPWVNSLQKTAEWSPWMGLDPDIQVTFEGPEAGGRQRHVLGFGKARGGQRAAGDHAQHAGRPRGIRPRFRGYGHGTGQL
jgi:hypothetical protein